MYASDTTLLELVESLEIRTGDPEHPFSAEDQVQPASIDLRLDRFFWRPRRKQKKIDLRSAQLLDISPRRHYQKIILEPTESITIPAGSALFARVYEEMTIPTEYAGEISGRSSFARLGLMIHCTGGFLNPGYRGHMPLQLVNVGATAIRIFPYLPICQVRLVKLTTSPTRVYGHEGLESKYANDDGGPSFWWRDKRIRQLHSSLEGSNLDVAIRGRIVSSMAKEEPEVIERLERYIDRLRQRDLENAPSILRGFAEKEDRRRFWRRVGIGAARGAFPLVFSLVLGTLLKESLEPRDFVGWIIAMLLILPFWRSIRTEVGDHYGSKELERSEAKG